MLLPDKLFCVFCLCTYLSADVPGPQVNLDNGSIQARVCLPDSVHGYYRGTRFDWSGVIARLTYKKHSYFEQWFDVYDPQVHDAIRGPVEDFAPLGYRDTAGLSSTGSTNFVKIGVGVLKKNELKPYQFSKFYPFTDHGKWSIQTGSRAVKFVHDLSASSGYAYHYTKIISLEPGQAELVVRHELRNTGKMPIETEVYDHNFFVIDKEPVGPALRIIMPFTIHSTALDTGSIARSEGQTIRFLRLLKKGEHAFSPAITGFGTTASDYDIRIENQRTGAGVQITSDQPLYRMVFWACSTTACPEPYIKINVLPGQAFNWLIRYRFYTLP